MMLNPVMSVIFAGVFRILWVYRPQTTYLRTLAVCYIGAAVGMALLVTTLPVGQDLTRALANLLVLLSVHCLALALFERAGLAFPHLIFGFISAAAYATFLWFLYVQPDVVARIYATNGGVATLSVTCAIMTCRNLRSRADGMMLALLILFAILSIGRPILTLPLDNLAPDDTIRLTRYWMLLSFTHAIISLLMVFALTTGFALDVLEKLQIATKTDPLSGLMNRRGFEEEGHKLIAGNRAAKVPLSIILADIDRFKSINDTYGHHVGDDVIAMFADAMRNVVKGGHILGRIGGEEFAVFVQGADVGVAELVAQGIRVGFGSKPVPGVDKTDHPPRMTASFGVTQFIEGETYVSLLGRADRALYQAKNDGRDCVRTATMSANTGDSGASGDRQSERLSRTSG